VAFFQVVMSGVTLSLTRSIIAFLGWGLWGTTVALQLHWTKQWEMKCEIDHAFMEEFADNLSELENDK